MKKVTKITLIVVGVLAGLGLFFCIVAAVLGVNLSSISNTGFYWDDAAHRFQSEVEGEVIDSMDQTFTDVTGLDIDLEIGEMTVKVVDSDEFAVHAVNVKKSFVCELKNGILYIENENRNQFRFWNNIGKNRGPQIVLEVPRGTVFDETQMNIGVGEIKLSDFQSKKLSIDCGVGSVNLEGRIAGDCDLNCGVGEIKMELSGNQEDFNYEVDCGVGDIKVGDHSYSGLGHSTKQNNNADYDMHIECGVGSVKVSFKN